MMYMQRIVKLLLVVLMVSGLLLASGVGPSARAYAQPVQTGSQAKGDPTTTDGKGGTVKCRTYQEAAGGTLLGVLIPCITKTMENATSTYSQQLIIALDPLLYSFITLVVVFFGVRVLQGNPQRLKAEAFFLAMKISIVIGMLQMVPTFWVPASYAMMTEGQAVVAGAINTTGIACEIDKFGDSNTPLIWKQQDCILGKLFGFVNGSGGKPNMLLMSSAFGMLGGIFFGGTFGVTLFLACIGVLWTMFYIVIRSAVTFVNGYMYVCVMLILSPLFMPMILLKQTYSIFTKWWQGILGAMLLPIIISSYVMFAMMVYDKVLFQPDSLFQKLFDPKFAAQVQKLPKKSCAFVITNTPEHRKATSGQDGNTVYKDPLMKNLIIPTLSGGNDGCSALSLPVLDMSSISPGDKNQQEVFKKMFHDVIKIVVVAWLISEGFKVIISATQKLLGSISASQISSATTKDENKIQGGIEGAKRGLYNAYGNETGSEFVKRTATVPQNVIKGFMDGIGKS